VFYKFIYRNVFLHIDAEVAHHLGMAFITFLQATGLLKLLPKVTNKKVDALGLEFDGVLGMAAGFDKNAKAVIALGQLGFSHVEIGTVTAHPQPGNEKPRLFRLPQDRALVNRMGFNNDGAAVVAKRLEKLRASNADLPIIGVNIGKSKITELADAVEDYSASTRLLAKHADYLAVNVSSPNTPGLRSLQSVESLKPILVAVTALAEGKPVLVKIAPDLNDEDIVEVSKLVLELGLAGIIATNTTIARSDLASKQSDIEAAGAGGLSGAPLAQRSLEVLKLIKATVGERASVISVGGIESAADIRERLIAGASLVQAYSAFIYEGPLWARKMNRALSR
jgi:dihydroorotate dehydrogenase